MHIYCRRAAVLLAGHILGFCCCPALFAADPFTIDDDQLTFDTLYSTTVYGFRAFPISNIVRRDSKDRFEINSDVLTQSLNTVMPGETVTFQELADPRTPEIWVFDSAPVFIDSNFEERTTLAMEKLSAPSSGQYDARFIVSAFSTELVNADFIQNYPGSVGEIEYIELNPDVAEDMLTVYAGLNSLERYVAAKVPVTFDQFDSALEEHSNLYAVAKLPIGDVEMGRPVFLEPDILGVQIPDEWRNTYNLKLVLFAITVRDYLEGVEKIDIVIKFPEDCMAFDLVPVNYLEEPVEARRDEEWRGILVETILGGEVKYQQRLKPVIEAYGLQSNEFGWRLRGEALTFGTTRVAALIRAPKNSNEVSMESAFVLRGPETWMVEGSIGSSKPEVHLISF